MREQVNAEDKRKFEKLGQVFGILFLLVILSPIPLVHFLNFIGIGIWLVLTAVAFYIAIALERKKKQFDIQTYREIIAFTEGTSLHEIAKAKEEAKRPYQKILLGIGSGVVTFIIALIFTFILK